MKNRILEAIRALPERETPHVVALAGGSCGGKTTLTRELVAELGDRLLVFEQDNFQLGNDFPNREHSAYRWDDPENFAPAEALEVLDTLLANRPAEAPYFDLKANVRSKRVTLEPRPLILFEGLYTLTDPFRSRASLGIYLEAPFYGRFVRRLVRFGQFVGLSETHVPLRHMVMNVHPAHLDFVVGQRERADLCFLEEYSFVSETLPRVSWKLEEPEGNEELRLELPEELSISIFRTKGGAPEFVLRHRSLPVVRCVTEDVIAERLSGIEWESR